MIKSQYNIKLRGRGRHATGFSILYLLVIMFALLVVVAIAVDWGRVQLARAQLQDSSDAAAYAGMTAIWDGPEQMRNRALAVALDNLCDGLPVELSSDEDVQIGRWDYLQKQFTGLDDLDGDDANALRVISRRTVDRENPIPMVFARIIGINTISIEAFSIAAVERPSNFRGMVGIDDFRIEGTPTVISDVATNGRMRLIGNMTVDGIIHLAGDDAWMDTTNRIERSYPPDYLEDPLYFPPVPPGPYVTQNDNDRISEFLDADGNFNLRRDFTLPGGVYYVNDFRVIGNHTLTITEQVTLYVTADVTILGTVMSDGDANNFRIRMLSEGTSAELGGTSALYADIYAPLSDVWLHGQGNSEPMFMGSIIGRAVRVDGRARLVYDDDLPPPGSDLQFPVALVR